MVETTKVQLAAVPKGRVRLPVKLILPELLALGVGKDSVPCLDLAEAVTMHHL